MLTQRITQAQVDYVLAHINDRPRVRVAEAAGICMSTVYRIMRENGGELRHDLSRRNSEHWEIVRRCYPAMTTREIADKYGILYGRVNKIARELGVRHSPEVRERMRAENAERVRASRSKIDFAASAAKRKRKRRYDELRIMSGLPQRTRFKFAKLTTQGRQTVWRMVKKRNYFQMDGEPRTLYYDGDTRRVYTEARLAKKYGLHFVAAGDYGEQQDD